MQEFINNPDGSEVSLALDSHVLGAPHLEQQQIEDAPNAAFLTVAATYGAGSIQSDTRTPALFGALDSQTRLHPSVRLSRFDHTLSSGNSSCNGSGAAEQDDSLPICIILDWKLLLHIC